MKQLLTPGKNPLCSSKEGSIFGENWSSEIKDNFDEYLTYYIRGKLVIKPHASRIRSDYITPIIAEEWLEGIEEGDKYNLEFVAHLVSANQKETLQSLLSHGPVQSQGGPWTASHSWKGPNPTRHKRSDTSNQHPPWRNETQHHRDQQQQGKGRNHHSKQEQKKGTHKGSKHKHQPEQKQEAQAESSNTEPQGSSTTRSR